MYVCICLTVLKGKWDRTFHSFTNNSSSRGSTVMFDLSKSFSQLYLEIYEKKIDFFFYISTLNFNFWRLYVFLFQNFGLCGQVINTTVKFYKNINISLFWICIVEFAYTKSKYDLKFLFQKSLKPAFKTGFTKKTTFCISLRVWWIPKGYFAV